MLLDLFRGSLLVLLYLGHLLAWGIAESLDRVRAAHPVLRYAWACAAHRDPSWWGWCLDWLWSRPEAVWARPPITGEAWIWSAPQPLWIEQVTVHLQLATVGERALVLRPDRPTAALPHWWGGQAAGQADRWTGCGRISVEVVGERTIRVIGLIAAPHVQTLPGAVENIQGVEVQVRGRSARHTLPTPDRLWSAR